MGFEFGRVSVRGGAHVSMVQRGRKRLVHFDPDLVDRLVEATRELGADIQLQAEVKAITASSGCLSVHASAPVGEQAVEADMAVHAAGRVPDIDDLDLPVAGVERTALGV